MFLNEGIVEFETLYNNNRFWKVLIKSNVCIRDISDEYLDNKVNQISIYLFTQYGVMGGKITTSALTEVYGKNKNKSNETTNIRQAIMQAISMMNKKKQAGFSITQNFVNDKLYPMALDIFSKNKEKINYPCFIQPKLDGHRMLIQKNGNGVDMDLLSRRLHDITGFNNIKEEAKELYSRLENEGCGINFLDGEVYLHGKPLQDISSIVRGNEDESKEGMEYHIFDICSIDKSMPCNLRFQVLSKIMLNSQFKHIKLVETKLCENEEMGDTLFEEYVNMKYEGIVYKQFDYIYEASSSREKRSLQYLKRKKQHDEEFNIVGYSEGKGKFKSLVIFRLQTPEGNIFDCVPMGTAEYRKKLWETCEKDFTIFKDKLAKVKFDDYSKSGTPTRAVIVQIDRDISFD
jgi:ATP-dependent DNA ligase